MYDRYVTSRTFDKKLNQKEQKNNRFQVRQGHSGKARQVSFKNINGKKHNIIALYSTFLFTVTSDFQSLFSLKFRKIILNRRGQETVVDINSGRNNFLKIISC